MIPVKKLFAICPHGKATVFSSKVVVLSFDVTHFIYAFVVFDPHVYLALIFYYNYITLTYNLPSLKLCFAFRSCKESIVLIKICQSIIYINWRMHLLL